MATKKGSDKRKKKLLAKKKMALTKAHQQNLESKTPGLPDYITCNECGGMAPKSTFEILDTKKTEGLDLVITGTCQDCGLATMAMSGDPDVVALYIDAFQEEMGGKGKMGVESIKI